jgi:hypothetical protein
MSISDIHDRLAQVASNAPVICLIEVKVRVSDEFASPQTKIDLRKHRQIERGRRADTAGCSV